MNKITTRFLLTLIVIVGLIGGAIYLLRDTSKSDTSKTNVTVSFYPLYDFAKNVGGDRVTVTNITPAGSEAHDYEPTPSQLISADEADVFVYNGTGMEGWVDSFLTEVPSTVVTVKASDNIDLMPLEEDHDEGEEGHDHGDSTIDPHFWLDPVLAMQIVDNIKDGLIKADPDGESVYEENATNYKKKLADLNNEFESSLAKCSDRVFVTAHKAFGYLANRYSLENISIAGISPDEEPSAAKLAELTDIINTRGIKYVFFEELSSPKIAETIASETGAELAVLDPIEGMTEDEQLNNDYISVQKENLQRLVISFNCEQ